MFTSVSYVADEIVFSSEDGSLLASLIQAVYKETAIISNVTNAKEATK